MGYEGNKSTQPASLRGASNLPPVDRSVSGITSIHMAALAVGDAVELLKGGAARPFPARCSHQRLPTARHGLCLSIRSTATRTTAVP